jgi:transposase, IS30 family
LLGQWKQEKVANKECARRLGRDIRTVQRELKRNNVRVIIGRNDWEIIYEPLHAQYVANQRKYKAYEAKQPLKNKDIYAYTLDHLRQGWSPEQIAGRLRYVEHPGDKHWIICHETIYQFVYKVKTDLTKQGFAAQSILDLRKQTDIKNVVCITDHEKPLYEYLRRKQKRRRKISGRKVQRVRIPDRVSIHSRPAVVQKRKQFGHWEGDSIVGLGHISGLHTQYERVTSLIRFEKLAWRMRRYLDHYQIAQEDQLLLITGWSM